MKIKTFGYSVLALSLLIAGLLPLFYIVGNGINPITLALYISLVGTIGSLILMLAKGTHVELAKYVKNRVQLGSLVFVGLVFALITLVFSYTTHYISASLLAVVYRSWPLFLILIAPLMLRERITKWDAIAVTVGFAGMAIVLLGSVQFSVPQSTIPYVLLVLLAAVADAFASAIQKRYHCELTSSLFVYNLVALIAIVPFALYFGAFTLPSLSSSALIAIFGLGIMQNIAMTYLFTLALRSTKTSLAGNSYMIVPFITMVLDALILHEAIELGYVVIAVSVVAGVAIQRLSPRATGYLPSGKSAKSLPVIYDITGVFINTENALIRKVMQGNGRVLAFYKHLTPEELEQHLGAIRSLPASDGLLIFTNKSESHHANADELDFIKDILGYNKDDLVVIGAGNPAELESAFADLNAPRSGAYYKPGPEVS